MGVSVDSVQGAKSKIKGKKKTAAPKQSMNSEPLDDMGFPVPIAALAYWNRKPEAKNALAQICATRGEVKKLLPDQIPMWSAVNLNGVIADLNSAFNGFARAQGAMPRFEDPRMTWTHPRREKCSQSREDPTEHLPNGLISLAVA